MGNATVDLDTYAEHTDRTNRYAKKSGVTIIEMVFPFLERGRIPIYPSRLEELCDVLTDNAYNPDLLLSYRGVRYKINTISRIEDFILPTRAVIRIVAWPVANEGKGC